MRSHAEKRPLEQNQHSPQLICKGYDDPIAHLQVPDFATHLDDNSHVLVAENVATFHGRLVAVIKMQVGAADRARRDFDDRVSGMLNGWVGYRIDPDIAVAVPA